MMVVVGSCAVVPTPNPMEITMRIAGLLFIGFQATWVGLASMMVPVAITLALGISAPRMMTTIRHLRVSYEIVFNFAQ